MYMKRYMKRFAAIFLAVMLVLSLGITAFAASTGKDNGTITITDNANGASVAGKTFNAYRLFDLTAESNGSSYDAYGSYAFSNPWVSSFFASLTPSITTVSDALQYVKGLDNEGMQAFAEQVKAYIQTNSVAYSATVTAPSGATSVQFTNLPIGYYIVTDASATATTTISACMINYTTPNTTITLKATNIPTFDKQENGQNVSEVYDAVGKILPFNLNSNEPDVTNYGSYIMKFSDQMSNGLTFNPDSMQVTIGSKVYQYDTVKQYFYDKSDSMKSAVGNISYTGNGNGFNVQLTLKNAGTNTAIYMGDKTSVRVDYTATINANAEAGRADYNGATLTYTNDPSGGTITTPRDIIRVYTVQIDVTKTNGTAPITTDTATFDLYGSDSTKAANANTIMMNSKTYYDYGPYTTDKATGKVSIPGLAPGQYYIKETRAPDGYNLLADPVSVNITKGSQGSISYTVNNGASVTAANGCAAVGVQDNAGLQLPGTGGMGTRIFTIGGCALIVLAGLFLVFNRKKIFGR